MYILLGTRFLNNYHVSLPAAQEPMQEVSALVGVGGS